LEECSPSFFPFRYPENDFSFQGAPIFLSPTQDDPVLAADPNRNNNFNYTIPDAIPDPGTENHFNQTRCPFGAHIRKVHPRGDLDPSVENQHFIIRSSIPYGPEGTWIRPSGGRQKLITYM
jgi:deferrochelatase/peroxidase EfeB